MKNKRCEVWIGKYKFKHNSIGELAKYLNVSTRTINRWIKYPERATLKIKIYENDQKTVSTKD